MNRPMLGKWLAIVLAVLWLFAVTFNYYIVHKPFGVENVLAMLNVLGDVLVASALFALAAALGRRITRFMAFGDLLEAIVFPTGLGLGLISFATFALGLVGLLTPVLFWVLLFVAAFLLRGDLRGVWRDVRALRFSCVGRFERALALFVGLSLAIAFLVTLTPPIAWDAQTYHLVEAKVALERGRIAAPPDIPYFSFPSLAEMLFLAAMLLKGDIAAQLIHFGFFLLLLGAVGAFAQRYFNARVAWLAIAILVAVPSLVLVSTWAYVDLTLAFYAFGAFCALAIAHEKGDWRWFALSGALAGLALGVKYTALIVPVALVILLCLWQRLRFAIVHVAFVVLFAAPWYLRNLVFTGNPVYPFFFGGPNWDVFRASWFSRFGTGLANAPLQLLTAPWDATVFGSEGALGYEATIGPLLLILLPFLLTQFSLRDSKPETRIPGFVFRGMLVFALVLYLFWLLGIAESKLLQQTRLLFPTFPLLALAAALAFDRLGDLDLPQFSLQRFMRLLVLLILGLTGLKYALAFAAHSPLPYLAGAESRADFLAANLGEYNRAVQFINSQLPRESQVLALWEPRSYYLRRAVQPDAILDSFEHLLWQTRDPDAIALIWQRAGYTHVLLNRQGLNMMLTSQYDPIDVDDAIVLQTTLERHARLLYGEPLRITGGQVIRADVAPFAVYVLDGR